MSDKYKQQFFILLSVSVSLRLIYIKYCPLDAYSRTRLLTGNGPEGSTGVIMTKVR